MDESLAWLPKKVRDRLNEYRKYQKTGSIRLNFCKGGIRNMQKEETEDTPKEE